MTKSILFRLLQISCVSSNQKKNLSLFTSFFKSMYLIDKTSKKTTIQLERLNYIMSLVKQVKRNDVVAMQTIYKLFSKEMLAVSCRITNNLQDAEDIIQEGFLTSFQKIDQLKDEAKYGGWLKQIIVNKSLASLKKRVNFQDLGEVSLPEEIDENQNWYQGVSFEKITNAIQELPNGSRQVFSLFLLENYTHKEIAEILNISVSTSKSQYRYALKLLKEKLNGIKP